MLGDPTCLYYKDLRSGNRMVLWQIARDWSEGHPSRFYSAATHLGQIRHRILGDITLDKDKFKSRKPFTKTFAGEHLSSFGEKVRSLEEMRPHGSLGRGSLPDELIFYGSESRSMWCVNDPAPEWVKESPLFNLKENMYCDSVELGGWEPIIPGAILVPYEDEGVECWRYLSILMNCSDTFDEANTAWINKENEDVRAWKVSDESYPFWVKCLIEEGAVRETERNDKGYKLIVTNILGNKPRKLKEGDYLLLNSWGVVSGTTTIGFQRMKLHDRTKYPRYYDLEEEVLD